MSHFLALRTGAIATALSLVLLVAGCSGGLHRDVQPTQVYVLRAAKPVTPTAAGQNTVRIGRTVAGPGLKSDRIVLVEADHRLNFYAASRWAAPLPEVVEALALETLRNTGAWAAVHDSRGAFPSDYYLQIAIRRFEADYTVGASPKISVVLDCTLSHRMDRERLVNFTAEGHADAPENRTSAVVGAFEQAAQAAMSILAERSAAALESEALKMSTSPSTP